MRTRPRRLIRGAALVLALGLSASGPAHAAKDAGLAATYPWSGYWWQHKSGGLTGPLSKYDQVFRTGAAGWEDVNHVRTATQDWFGHCHAWSASSVLEREPRAPRPVGPAVFGVGDQKGLLAACHAADVANSHGDRYGDHNGSEDFADLRPEELWRLLQLYVQRQRIPLILDLEPGEQVWNYPIYQYEVDYAPSGDGWYSGVITLVAADNNVVPDFVGTQYVVHRYPFRVQARDGAFVLGSGQWMGPSVQDHPDFAWYPYVAVAENPEVDVDKVAKVVGYTVGGGATPPTTDGPPGPVVPTPNPTPTPGPSPDTNHPPGPGPAPNGGGGAVVAQVAQPIDLDRILDPYELVAVVTNKTSHFPFDLFIDRGDGGKYDAGQPIRISVRSGEAGYLYLFDVDKEGNLRLVFPRAGQPNRIEADTQYDFPAADEPPLLSARGQGQHDLKGIVTSSPIRISGTRVVAQVQQQQQSPPRTKPKPGQQQRAGAQISTAAEPEAIVVPPATQVQMKQLVLDGLRNKGAGTKPDPKKLGRFAQDMCAYFVQFPAGKPGKTKAEPADDVQ